MAHSQGVNECITLKSTGNFRFENGLCNSTFQVLMMTSSGVTGSSSLTPSSWWCSAPPLKSKISANSKPGVGWFDTSRKGACIWSSSAGSSFTCGLPMCKNNVTCQAHQHFFIPFTTMHVLLIPPSCTYAADQLLKPQAGESYYLYCSSWSWGTN